MKLSMIAALQDAAASRRPVAFAKRLSDGAEFLLPDAAAPASLNDAGAAALAADQSGTQAIDGEAWFIEARNPSPRLFVIGAVHIAQTLVPLAKMMGFSVVLIDPRQRFANALRFPETDIRHEWPDRALETLRPDVRTALVALTHDPKLDDPALDQALRSDAFYIGALGSRKSHAARLERLGALGHDAVNLQRIRGPVGLNIGAVNAEEIALSIIAEIVAVRRNGGLAIRAAHR